MSVEYRDSTVTNMNIHNSKIGYSRLLLDSNKFQHSVYCLRQSPFKVATICLGVLCAVLLAGVIGQTIHYRKVEQDYQNQLKGVNEEKENLQQDVRSLQRQKGDLQVNRNQLQQDYDRLSKRKAQTEINNNLLTEETNKLKLSQSQLQASSAALSKELEQLKVSTTQLQSNNNALTIAKNLLQEKYNVVLKRKNELQTNYDSVTQDRNNLQNKFNIVTRAKDKLQGNYSTLITDVEHLRERFNFSSIEKDKLASSHQNLTIAKDTLQASYDILVKGRDELQATYNDLVVEKQQLESSCSNVTAERDVLKVKNDNLTEERDQLQMEVARLNATIAARKCPFGWQMFEFSCYYTSSIKKNWKQSRDFCKTKGADLTVIKSQEEMTFINGLYTSDKEVWIGLTDEGREGQWTWVDGSALTTAYWGKGQPNSFDGRNQDCVEFWHKASGTGDWNDENCKIEQYFICEM